ncbi:MAG: hypothetical protein APF83_01230 [Lutibacter sp. BRH_c52]|nr:MAG: hypothetical protein APF83_01230 [Lutibacter sp. BRH_c52]
MPTRSKQLNFYLPPFQLQSNIWHQLFQESNHKHLDQQIEKQHPCFAAATALRMFSWGNLPFPQTPMDAFFFEIMPIHPIS